MRGNSKTSVSRGAKSDGCGRTVSIYHVYSVNRITGEGRADF